MGENDLHGNHEIEEGIVVAQKDIRGFESFDSNIRDFCAVTPQGRGDDKAREGAQI